jgi:uncharacterized protein YijF (DUF1287 family)
MKIFNIIWATIFALSFISCHQRKPANSPDTAVQNEPIEEVVHNEVAKELFEDETVDNEIAKAAFQIVNPRIIYDPSYVVIPYPNGDVPENTGVCTDVVIRTYRKLGIDLQKEVHEDMTANFDIYPKRWGMSAPDKNIDHRRVPNLMKFFSRKGTVLKITDNPEDYQPGDIVCWNLGYEILHIGIVSRVKSIENPDRYYMVHNIGGGQVLEDCLFYWKIIGHYLYKQ